MRNNNISLSYIGAKSSYQNEIVAKKLTSYLGTKILGSCFVIKLPLVPHQESKIMIMQSFVFGCALTVFQENLS